MRLRPGHLEIPARDPVRTARFYADVLGFEVFDVQAETFHWLKLGDLELLVRPGPPDAAGGDLARPNLVLYTDDAPAARERVRRAGVEPEQRGACLLLQDPDGHWIQVVDPRDHQG